MKRFSWVLFIMFALGYFSQSEASLIDRGNGLIYIDFLDLTWLQDANYAFTSGYDADGKMFWGEANNWANNLVYNGISGWRLPGKVEGHTGLEITSSEMGYLYLYKNLNNQGEILDTGPFINLQASSSYWLNIHYDAAANSAVKFNFYNGTQNYSLVGSSFYAWAVNDGDIGLTPVPVPEPSTLLITGLILFIATRSIKKMPKY